MIWLLVRGRRASIPRSATRRNAVNALTEFRSVLMWSREVTRTRTAARAPSSAHGCRRAVTFRGRTA